MPPLHKYNLGLRHHIEVQRFLDSLRYSSGCCVICYNDEPFVLEEHHIAGRNNSDITVTVCANHHVKLTRMQKTWNSRWKRDNNSLLEAEAFLFNGLADVLRQRSAYLMEREHE